MSSVNSPVSDSFQPGISIGSITLSSVPVQLHQHSQDVTSAKKLSPA